MSYTIWLNPNEGGQQQSASPKQQLSEDEIVRRVQLGNIQGNTRLLEAQLFLNGLAEIRMALNLPSVSDKDAGIGERQPLQPMFDEQGVDELRNQYLKVLRSFIRYSDAQLEVLAPRPEKTPA